MGNVVRILLLRLSFVRLRQANCSSSAVADASCSFQVVEGQSALHTPFRLLPLVVVGLIINVLTGILVNKASASILLLGACSLSAVSPLLFAVLSPKWSYWAAAFPAMCLSPISEDLLYILSNLVITNAFPDETQALAGSIFNTVGQLGNSVGLAATAMLAFGHYCGGEALSGSCARRLSCGLLHVLRCRHGGYDHCDSGLEKERESRDQEGVASAATWMHHIGSAAGNLPFPLLADSLFDPGRSDNPGAAFDGVSCSASLS